MLENLTRTSTSPGVSASGSIVSNPAAILPSRSWIRNALNALMSLPVEPDLETLAVELHVVVEEPVPPRVGLREAVRVEPGRHHRKHPVAKLARAVRRIAVAQAQVRVGHDALFHLAREALEVLHLAVMRQEDRARTVRHE